MADFWHLFRLETVEEDADDWGVAGWQEWAQPRTLGAKAFIINEGPKIWQWLAIMNDPEADPMQKHLGYYWDEAKTQRITGLLTAYGPPGSGAHPNEITGSQLWSSGGSKTSKRRKRLKRRRSSKKRRKLSKKRRKLSKKQKK